MWLKVERLVSIHISVVKEMQTNLRDFLGEPEVEDNWLDASPDDMEKIRDLVQEDLVKPTANLADLMYKSVEIRDSRYVSFEDDPSWLVLELSVLDQIDLLYFRDMSCILAITLKKQY